MVDVAAPGPLLLLGSGESAPNAQKGYTWLFQQIPRARQTPPAPLTVAVLETPAGFEPNSAQVASQVGGYLEKHLVNFAPRVEIVAARARGTSFSPDDAATVAPLWEADVIMAGPGSPSYAVRQLRGSLAWEIVRARHRLGAGLAFSSAGTLAVSSHTLPVYEIYKVGEELHWKQGLDLSADFGLPLVFVSHWNNSDGGRTLDTSRCYMGHVRFERLRALLPPSLPIVGIDEKTALGVDFARRRCYVMGAGGVTLVRAEHETHVGHGQEFALAELGAFCLPAEGEGIAPEVWAEAVARHTAEPPAAAAPPDVLALVSEREAARARRDWATSDRLRAAITARGWQVQDTPGGPELTAQG